MENKEIKVLIDLRQKIIENFNQLRDYKANPNAIMKEKDHAQALHNIVVEIDKILKSHVNFSDKK